MSKEQTPITDKVLDNILFKISICSSKYHKREVLREEINAKVLEALEVVKTLTDNNVSVTSEHIDNLIRSKTKV